MQKFLIVMRSLMITLLISLAVIFVSFCANDKGKRNKFDRLVRFWTKKLLKIIQLSCRVSNPYKTQCILGKSYIVMSNHASLYDIPLIFMALPGSIRMIAKRELFKVPIWGRAMHAAEFIPMDRKDRRQAVLDLKNAEAKMASGIIPWIAPEGTRTRTGKLQDFKKGGFLLAIKARATIIPVAIRGAYEILPPKTLDFQIKSHVDIFVGEPIDTTKYSIKEIDRLMRDVRDSIAKDLSE